MNPDVILLNGTSSAGKTSLARALPQRAGIPLYHLSPDTFTAMFRWVAITAPANRPRRHAPGLAERQWAHVHRNQTHDFGVDTSLTGPDEGAVQILAFIRHRPA